MDDFDNMTQDWIIGSMEDIEANEDTYYSNNCLSRLFNKDE